MGRSIYENDDPCTLSHCVVAIISGRAKVQAKRPRGDEGGDVPRDGRQGRGLGPAAATFPRLRGGDASGRYPASMSRCGPLPLVVSGSRGTVERCLGAVTTRAAPRRFPYDSLRSTYVGSCRTDGGRVCPCSDIAPGVQNSPRFLNGPDLLRRSRQVCPRSRAIGSHKISGTTPWRVCRLPP